MRIDKVTWITARICGKQKWHSIASSLGWKGENFGTRHCLTKCALENKLLNQNCWSWYHFSQEKLLHTLILVIVSTYCGKYAVPFFMGHPVYTCTCSAGESRGMTQNRWGQAAWPHGVREKLMGYFYIFHDF